MRASAHRISPQSRSGCDLVPSIIGRLYNARNRNHAPIVIKAPDATMWVTTRTHTTRRKNLNPRRRVFSAWPLFP
jgi:hypothetical protein